jgi:hypothetical protein
MTHPRAGSAQIVDGSGCIEITPLLMARFWRDSTLEWRDSRIASAVHRSLVVRFHPENGNKTSRTPKIVTQKVQCDAIPSRSGAILARFSPEVARFWRDSGAIQSGTGAILARFWRDSVRNWRDSGAIERFARSSDQA